MDHFRLNKLKEVDINVLIDAVGGRRAVDDHSTEGSLNADYLLDEAVIELKLFEEEGLERGWDIPANLASCTAIIAESKIMPSEISKAFVQEPRKLIPSIMSANPNFGSRFCKNDVTGFSALGCRYNLFYTLMRFALPFRMQPVCSVKRRPAILVHRDY